MPLDWWGDLWEKICWITFDVLSGALNNIHCHYRIQGKVVRTTTDSSSKFVKAFSIAESDTGQDCPDDEFDAEYQDTFSILEQDNSLEYQLTTHQRCAWHFLNLFATTEADVAEQKNDRRDCHILPLGNAKPCGISQVALTLQQKINVDFSSSDPIIHNDLDWAFACYVASWQVFGEVLGVGGGCLEVLKLLKL